MSKLFGVALAVVVLIILVLPLHTFTTLDAVLLIVYKPKLVALATEFEELWFTLDVKLLVPSLINNTELDVSGLSWEPISLRVPDVFVRE